jgi:hypothetical protein
VTTTKSVELAAQANVEKRPKMFEDIVPEYLHNNCEKAEFDEMLPHCPWDHKIEPAEGAQLSNKNISGITNALHNYFPANTNFFGIFLMRLVPLNINICRVTQNGMCHMSRDCCQETYNTSTS